MTSSARPTSTAAASTPWWKPSGRTLSRSLFGVLWALIAAEFFLRIFAPVPLLPRYVVATDYGIRGNQANQIYRHRTPDYTVEIRTNSAGMRADEEIPLEKPEGTKRVLVLGDSFSLGYGVDLEDTFTAEMSRRLEQELGPIQIVNLSVSGHGNAEELIVLREEGLKYDPDLVLLGWHRTDLNDNVRSGLFTFEGEELVRKNATFLPQVKLRERLFSFAAYRWLAGNSHLYAFVREGAGKAAKSFLAAAKSIDPGSAPRVLNSAPEKVASLEQDPQAPIAPTRSRRSRLTIALLRELMRESEAGGAELLVLDVPNTMGRSRFSSAFPDLAGTNLEGRLNVVSPIDAFGEHVGELIYWEQSHFHFTPFGCDLVGEVLADYILEHRLLSR